MPTFWAAVEEEEEEGGVEEVVEGGVEEEEEAEGVSFQALALTGLDRPREVDLFRWMKIPKRHWSPIGEWISQ